MLNNNELLIPNIINNINFTNREIDIIACLLSGRSTKKIASLLFISHRTVENHIRNIMTKLECSSREHIIDFLEKTEQLPLFKTRYANILIKIKFESELKKIATIIKSIKPVLSIYYSTSKEQNQVVLQFEKYLTMAGIKCFTIELSSKDNLNSIIKHKFTDDYSLYLLSIELVELLQKINQNISVEDLAIKLTTSSFSIKTIFLLLDSPNQQLINFLKGCKNLYINILEQKNYYFLIFNIVKKLLPDINIERNIEEFEKQYKNFDVTINLANSFTINKNYFIQVIVKKIKILLTSFKNFYSYIQSNLPRYSKYARKLFNTIKTFLIIFFIAVISTKTNCKTWINFFKTEQKITSLVQNPKNWNIPRQDYIFIGRKEELKKLQEALHTTKTLKTNSLIVNACSGLGGVGKTQLALEYIHNTKYPYTMKAWFSAENLQQLRQQYIEFAKRLGYQEARITTEAAIDYIKIWLAQHPGWLLVYDNVESYKEIANFLPSEGGYIILTTRNCIWPNNFSLLTLDVMTEKEAIALMQSLVKYNLNQKIDKVKELVKILGYLPLAIAQSGCYIQHNHTSIEEYLNIYKKHEEKLLEDHNTLPSASNILPVATTWNVTLESITQEAKVTNQAPVAIHLLTACSYLDPDNIPYNVLLTWLKTSYPDFLDVELLLTKFIGHLRKYSLIKKEEKGNISIHRLVQAVIRYQHKKSLVNQNDVYPPFTLRWYNNLIKSINEQFDLETELLTDEIRKKSLLPHMQMLLYHYETTWPTSIDFTVASLINNIGTILYLMGEPHISNSYYNRALSIFKKYYGQNHTQVANLLTNIGKNYSYSGEIEKSRNYCAQASLILENIYGKNHIKTTDALDCLANAYREAGKAKKAETIHNQVLKIKESYYGKNHIEVAYTLDNLGWDHINLGDCNQAIKFHERALKVKEYYYGKEHGEVASTVDHIGREYRNLGDAKKAKQAHILALKIKEKHYGNNHFKITYTLDQLGNAYRDLGDFNNAKQSHERALTIKEQYYGKEHFEISYTLNELGRDYRNLGYTKKAKELHERALQIGEQYYGKNHFQISHIIDQLGIDYKNLGDIKISKQLHERALAIKEQYYGKEHFEISYTLNYLGSIYREEGDPVKGKQFHERALSIKEKYYGKEHFEVTSVLDQLGTDYRVLGDYETAKQFHERSLKIKEIYYGKEHFEVANTLNELGTDYRNLFKLKKAKQFHERSLKIKEQYYGKENLEVALILYELSIDYKILGYPQKEQQFYEQYLKIKNNKIESYF